MRITAEEGTRVLYTGTGGYDHDKDHANKFLEKGNYYTIEKTEIHSWKTNVYLKEIKGQFFNSAHFNEICNACHIYIAVEDHDKCHSCKGIIEHNFKNKKEWSPPEFKQKTHIEKEYYEVKESPLDCPFCGSDDLKFVYDNHSGHGDRSFQKGRIECQFCSGAKGSIADYGSPTEKHEQQAWLEWNTRN